jgi:hypothetical protein
VGSVALLFHRYEGPTGTNRSPVHSHCGDGADTHFYIGGEQLYLFLDMRAGRTITADYSIFALPSIVTTEQVTDLNEVDLYYFGTAAQAKSKIARWYGSKSVLGLIREGGFRLPTPRVNAARCRRVNDMGNDRIEPVPVQGGHVEVFPGFVTIVDAGALIVKR